MVVQKRTHIELGVIHSLFISVQHYFWHFGSYSSLSWLNWAVVQYRRNSRCKFYFHEIRNGITNWVPNASKRLHKVLNILWLIISWCVSSVEHNNMSKTWRVKKRILDNLPAADLLYPATSPSTFQGTTTSFSCSTNQNTFSSIKFLLSRPAYLWCKFGGPHPITNHVIFS